MDKNPEDLQPQPSSTDNKTNTQSDYYPDS